MVVWYGFSECGWCHDRGGFPGFLASTLAWGWVNIGERLEMERVRSSIPSAGRFQTKRRRAIGQGRAMRFSIAVATVVLALGALGVAQGGKGQGGKGYGSGGSGASARAAAKSQPKSTVPMKVAGPKAGGSSSKQLQKVENEKIGKGQHSRKTHVRTVRANKESHSGGGAINFNGRGGKGTGLNAHGGGSLKGRLKQKGKGKQN